MVYTNKYAESLLEMMYFQPLGQLLADHYGRHQLSVVKPSPNREAYLGFDQGWIHTSTPTIDFENRLRNAIATNKGPVDLMYIGYFLQFKVVRRIKKRHKKNDGTYFAPPEFSYPHMRAHLDLTPNKKTQLSQHETLLRLAGMVGTEVYYACPMVFGSVDVLGGSLLDALRLVEVSSSPQGWQQNEKHCIFFQNQNASPFWYSEPVEARSLSAKEWAQDPKSYVGPFHPRELLEYLKKIRLIEKKEGINALSHLTIVELGAENRR